MVLVIACVSVSRIVRDRSDLDQSWTRGKTHLGPAARPTRLRAEREDLEPLRLRAGQATVTVEVMKKRPSNTFLPASPMPKPEEEDPMRAMAPVLAKQHDLDDSALDVLAFPGPRVEEEELEGQMEVPLKPPDDYSGPDASLLPPLDVEEEAEGLFEPRALPPPPKQSRSDSIILDVPAFPIPEAEVGEEAEGLLEAPSLVKQPDGDDSVLPAGSGDEEKEEDSQEDASAPRGEDACFCVFDVDRILTGRRRHAVGCHRKGTRAPAHGGNSDHLTLSKLRQGAGEGVCKGCHLGVVSAGGDSTTSVIKMDALRRLTEGEKLAVGHWSSPKQVTSPLVMGCPEHRKPACAKGVVDWYKKCGVGVHSHNTYFFDEAAMMARMRCVMQ